MSRRKVHLLLVEDERLDRRFIRNLLSLAADYDFIVFEAETLNAALTQLDNRPIDLVLLDLTLPYNNGIDVLHKVLNHGHANIPVLVLSGREDRDTSRLCVRMGAEEFLLKSSTMTPASLERVIDGVLERHQRGRERLARFAQTRYTVSKGLSGAPPPVQAEMAEPSLRVLMTVVEDGILPYLARNNPHAYEAVKNIIDQGGWYGAIRDLRAVLQLDVERETLSAPDALRSLLQTQRKTPVDESLSDPEAAQAYLDRVFGGSEDA